VLIFSGRVAPTDRPERRHPHSCGFGSVETFISTLQAWQLTEAPSASSQGGDLVMGVLGTGAADGTGPRGIAEAAEGVEERQRSTE